MRWGLLLLLVAARPLGAQGGDALQRAYDAERRGSSQVAADAYREYLKLKPAEVSALVGLERTLTVLGKFREVLPDVQRAMNEAPANATVLSLAVRAYAAADMPDSARAATDRWAAVEPDSDAPYRELGLSLLQRRNRPAARAAFLAGRQKLGVPEALAGEVAQVLALESDYAGSAREWLLAMRRIPGYRQSASSSLSPAPDAQRAGALAVLDGAPSFEPKRVAADLRVRWGRPEQAIEVFERILPEGPTGLEGLRSLAEQLRVQSAPEARRAMGRTLEAIAQRSPALAAPRVRLEAARAWAEGGERERSRTLLMQLAAMREIPPDVLAQAEIQLIGVLIDDGKVQEAESRLVLYRASATVDEYLALVRKVAIGHARAGRFGVADSILAADSTVDGMALQGRVRLWQGDLALAVELMQQAGPFAGTREDVSSRTQVFALLQGIERDSLPALGQALLALDIGDTAAAVTGLQRLAEELPVEKGGAETRVLLGRLLAARGDTAGAEVQFRKAASPEAQATVAAAGLELGRLLLAAGRREEAIPVLEQVILAYPSSALIPLVRRVLDEARGAVPPATS
jgi:tetratricopeptide (TPR) repeat protein